MNNTEIEYIFNTICHLRNKIIFLKSKDLKSNEIKYYYVVLVNALYDLRRLLKSLILTENLKKFKHGKKEAKKNIKAGKKFKG